MPHLTRQQIEHLRSELNRELREAENLLTSSDHFGMGHAQNISQELSAYDNHPGDMASELYEREKDLALNEHAELHRIAVLESLERMDAGTYGTCVACGKKIPYERLQAVPSTRFCVQHAEDEASLRRPVEETFLQPPFGRTSLDEREDQTQFDGEDAWQIVSEWGTSTSPALAENRNMGDYDEAEFEETDHDGYVEAIESFLATDITGRHITVVRNAEYRSYMENQEGDHDLEADMQADELS
ncbi:molecular chaperone DnaK [Xylanibacillus composti]|uniref:TraR/DksA C4-type zinc finger protein n=1 Tax=Xylanibacillus composti TaxID=1572762 RepID=A0A8J4M0X6_9BACL|nr:TraR/DksA C4-type zinc finger protein [Xylanibacillus composti]MDT9724348.1 molecular chaperone DnaK [Xylanibacillus composti]GIQ67939.1 TraR/DksA C4-type zinc finger protein [Xylanibacillus composti]